MESTDEEICNQYGGQYQARQPEASDLCLFDTDVLLNTEDELLIRKGGTWEITARRLDNFGVINIEQGVELIFIGGILSNKQTASGDKVGRINNHGLLSLQHWVEQFLNLKSIVENQSIITNLGRIDLYGDISGDGEIINLCDGTYNVIPDWPVREQSASYDLSGALHVVKSISCGQHDSDGDGVADSNDLFPFNGKE